jgi:ribonuclease E
MSNSKMLIDATHPEETRVVVLRGGRIEEFDYESAARKLLRGNIFLAKVTRVEPSLQAAFVDYGGNRHGFLAFNEIHPDYYQIPVADRLALIEEEAAAEAAEEAAADEAADRRAEQAEYAGPSDDEAEDTATDVTAFLPPEPEAPSAEASTEPEAGEPARGDTRTAEARSYADERIVAAPETSALAPEAVCETPAIPGEESVTAAPVSAEDGGATGTDDDLVQEVDSAASAEQVESVSGGEDALEELPSRPRRRLRSYKIQEVIKRRQVILVQVVKEERGSKGAALTTYLSLAGRYTVLMPNTARGGGISRKITNAQDRKRLKAIAQELEVPEGMGLIIRTAGASRTKQEIKRDFEYLLRLWENVRELTLQSTAPSLVYEEGDLIKRSIRDLYSKDIDEILVAGEAAHKEAKDFMRMLMPSHVKNVVLFQEPEPLFTRFQVERQLNAMFSPYVHLKSGGYLVINQTEALVAVDVNSGKSTREFSIEETALNTNLEAADEIARQLKLRDLAGLIVIDFIDMEEKRNNRAVERRLKEALRFDRARIQVGRISHFGLLEMSRQRLRSGVLERSTSQCPHCQGTGIIRSTESVALAVLRGLEDALMSGPPTSLVAKTTASVALYILNNKRSFVNDMEARCGITITVQASDKLQGANFTIEKASRAAEVVRRPERVAVNMDWGFEGEEAEEEEVVPAAGGAEEAGEDGEGRRSRRRRRRRGRGRGERPEGFSAGRHHPADVDQGSDADEGGAEPALNGHDEEQPDAEPAEASTANGEHDEVAPSVEVSDEGGEDRRGRRGRRRGRRGGRRDRDHVPVSGAEEQPEFAYPPQSFEAATPPEDRENVTGGGEEPTRAARATAEPPSEREGNVTPLPTAAEPAAPFEAAERGESHVAEAGERAAPRSVRTAPVASEPVLERVVVRSDTEPAQAAEETDRPARRGWWQRRFGTDQ